MLSNQWPNRDSIGSGTVAIWNSISRSLSSILRMGPGFGSSWRETSRPARSGASTRPVNGRSPSADGPPPPVLDDRCAAGAVPVDGGAVDLGAPMAKAATAAAATTMP